MFLMVAFAKKELTIMFPNTFTETSTGSEQRVDSMEVLAHAVFMMNSSVQVFAQML